MEFQENNVHLKLRKSNKQMINKIQGLN